MNLRILIAPLFFVLSGAQAITIQVQMADGSLITLRSLSPKRIDKLKEKICHSVEMGDPSFWRTNTVIRRSTETVDRSLLLANTAASLGVETGFESFWLANAIMRRSIEMGDQFFWLKNTLLPIDKIAGIIEILHED